MKDLRCPCCGSDRLYRDGIRQTSEGPVQRWLCRTCFYRFVPQVTRTQGAHHSDAVCAEKSPKNTVQVLNLEEGDGKKAEITNAGTSQLDQATVRGKIVEFHWWMMKQGYDEKTAKSWAYLIGRLAVLGADLQDPDSVKDVLARNKWGDGYKANFVEAFGCYLKMEGRSWKPPRYKRPQNMAFIPTETEIDQLIAAAGPVTGAFLQGLKDTGADPGELGRVRWIDVDREARTVRINFPVKGHNARILRVSDEFLGRISTLPKKRETIFRYIRMATNFWAQRKRIARKLQNPKILQIHFTTFRHWKGTTEYHRTRDILYVQKLLGHRSVQSTMVYIDYEKGCFGSSASEEFTVKVALNADDACKLIEVGFEYVTGDYTDGGKIFRKRK